LLRGIGAYFKSVIPSRARTRGILNDKEETKENRQLSASALQAIAPEAMQTHARELLLDPKEYDDIQATSLTALTQFGSAAKVEKDEEFPLLVT
jgi:hypothetical protein